MTQPGLQPVALITGAGSGIGQALALELSEHNYRLVLVGRREDRLLVTQGMLQSSSSVFPCDVRDAAACAAAVEHAQQEFGRLDVLVNNAAIAPCVPISQHSPEMIRDVFEVNALGPAYLTVAAWKVFERQFGDDEVLPGRNRPCIINISSMSTIDPFPGLFAYAASKGALNTMVKSCVNEGRDLGIRCFSIAFGSVETAMLRGIVSEDLLPRERTIPPAAAAAFITEYVLGQHDEDSGKVIVVPNPTAGEGWADEAG
jgi:NAD(P)-dependent dehydrogenase (short-subunit alcohol dehydrogenase family)